MRPHSLANLGQFGQIWVKFGQNLGHLGKIWTNLGIIWGKFG